MALIDDSWHFRFAGDASQALASELKLKSSE
jgi:hypothetical protein